MMILTKMIEKQLIKNHETNRVQLSSPIDFEPVVKLLGGTTCSWLLTEYNPDTDLYFGLADLGMGFAELGYVNRTEIEQIRFKPFGLKIERDRYFRPDKTLNEYAKASEKNGRIVT